MSKLYLMISVLFFINVYTSEKTSLAKSLYILNADDFSEASILPFYQEENKLYVILCSERFKNQSTKQNYYAYSYFTGHKQPNENSLQCALRGYDDQAFADIQDNVCSSYVLERSDKSKHVIYFVNFTPHGNGSLDNFLQKASDKKAVVLWKTLVEAIKNETSVVKGARIYTDKRVLGGAIRLQSCFIKNIDLFFNSQGTDCMFYDNDLTPSIKVFVKVNKNNFFIGNLIGQQKILTVTALTFLIYFLYQMNTMYNFV